MREAAAESAADIVRELLSISDLDRALERVLPRIGSMTACQRVSLLMCDHIDGRPCHRLSKEWMARGQTSEAELGFVVLFDDEAPPGAIADLESGSPSGGATARQFGMSSVFETRRWASLCVADCRYW